MEPSNTPVTPHPASEGNQSDQRTLVQDPVNEKQHAVGERQGQLAPQHSVEFFDPRIAGPRKQFFIVLGSGTLLTAFAIFAFLSIYWGALWKTPDELAGLNGVIVDFDGGSIGASVTQALEQVSGATGFITWQPWMYGSIEDVQQDVTQNEVWAAVVINQGATQSLQNAVSNIDGSYNGSLAVTVYVNQAHNQNAFSYITTSYQEPLLMASQEYADRFIESLGTNANLATIAQRAPQLLSSPWSFTTSDLRPFDVPVANAVVFVGLIYLVIISFLVVNQEFVGRQALLPYLKLTPLIYMRILTPLVSYFFLSLAYALLSLAFQVPFDRKFGPGGFVVYWMLCWCGMLALGMPLEAGITILTQKFIAYGMILFIISNVSVAFLPIEALPGIYRYGYAMPFYHFSEAARCIIFSTRNQLGLNFAALLAWAFIATIIMITVEVVKHRRSARQVQREEAKAYEP